MSKSRVVIAGGGVAALEAALALRSQAADLVEAAIFCPRPEFVYRPQAVGEPFGAAEASRYDLADLCARAGVEFHLDSIVAVDTESRLAVTHDGERFPYDYLLVAAGTQLLWPVPGAVTFWGSTDETGVRSVMDSLRAGTARSVAFTMPALSSWGLPVYELALLSAAELERAGVEGVRMTVVTPEDAPLALFGRGVSEQLSALLAERGIEVLAGTHPVRFEGGQLLLAPGDPLAVDAAISLPRLEGRRIRGLPHDPSGFVRIDDHCRVLGREHVFAAGDITSFPIKQGGIATQQADVVAATIAAELGGSEPPPPLDPVLRGILWTGKEPRYLQSSLGGGRGDDSIFARERPWPEVEGKIVGRYLTSFLAEAEPSAVAAPTS